MKQALIVAMTLGILTGCTTAPPVTAADSSVTAQTVRVLSTVEIGIFTGDVEEIAYSHTLEPVDPPGQTFVAIARDRCPTANDQHRLYAVELRREPVVVGLREGQSSALASNMVIVACSANAR